MRIVNKDVNLISYLPEFLQKYREFKEISNTENLEFQLIWNMLEKEFKNQFIEETDKSGILYFENLLNIKVEDNRSLDIRKFNVLSKWGSSLPYTYLKLKNILHTLSEGSTFDISLNNDEYYLKIDIKNIQPLKRKIVFETIKNIIPANLKLILAENEWRIEFEKELKVFSVLTHYITYRIGG